MVTSSKIDRQPAAVHTTAPDTNTPPRARDSQADSDVSPSHTPVAPSKHVQRILLECSFTYRTDMRTGIQRVVRQYITAGPAIGQQMHIQVVPVVFRFGRFWAISRLKTRRKPVARIRTFLKSRLKRLLGTDETNTRQSPRRYDPTSSAQYGRLKEWLRTVRSYIHTSDRSPGVLLLQGLVSGLLLPIRWLHRPTYNRIVMKMEQFTIHTPGWLHLVAECCRYPARLVRKFIRILPPRNKGAIARLLVRKARLSLRTSRVMRLARTSLAAIRRNVRPGRVVRTCIRIPLLPLLVLRSLVRALRGVRSSDRIKVPPIWYVRTVRRMRDMKSHTRQWLSRVSPPRSRTRAALARRQLELAARRNRLIRICYNAITKIGAGLTAWRHKQPLRSTARKLLAACYNIKYQQVEPGNGDALVLLDSSWHGPFWHEVAQARRNGASTAVLLYDLIPLRHPELVDDSLRHSFGQWFGQAIMHCDMFLCISDYVRNDALLYATMHHPQYVPRTDQWHTIRLGSTLPAAADTRKPSKVMQAIVARTDSRPVYLAVGTIEPRKNHTCILDAFERVWQTIPDIHLCIIGAVGRGGEPIYARMAAMPQFGRHLHVLTNADDATLACAYRHARAVIFASIAEGFGLPVVEALQYGKPVFASDIPVHRETGEHYCAYFNPDDPGTLADMIVDTELGRPPDNIYNAADFIPTTWADSCRTLLATVESHASNRTVRDSWHRTLRRR